MNPVLKELTGLVRGPVKAATHLANRPVGINVIDRFRHLKTLEDAVAGQVVLITGASSGIGAAAALQIGTAGGTVVLVARGREKLEDTAAEIEAAGGTADVQPCDLTDMEAIDRLTATSKAALDTFSDAVQGEVLDDGVRFTTIHMPLVRTPMIAPTKMYRRFPTLSPEQAADLIARAIIYRPRRLGPPFGHAAALADAISPEAMDVVRNRGYRMFPDSRAARGEVDGKSDEQTTPAGEAFARVTRGVHW
jgi:NAD(P)-dependent dehydrogenase (short-subunit alcohol dehydrogenase family)